jgi:predicted nucleic acid-binding protein
MFIDTSGFFSIHSQADKQHGKADEIYNRARFRLTTNYVLDELVALSTARGLAREKILAFSEEVLIDEAVEIFWVNKDMHAKAVELLKNRKDKSYSLCDAVSFVVMRERKITEALTSDHHFEQENFIRLLK